ncbi:uncharacterized protein BX664DRAFT_330233 [Halteromyces radiatus]|uniref:uncharacterized protein n=1 Tax=Halteromyces radiatus TaxID=101107 RepID=UPI00222049DF|nr:uncharacterized protein BX664DRAFT_330233 [Halteromyces radiatus]KAI8093649.1 hypothetical protein BX664DRAFT_330233 [Halteromyces radiatus]
MNPKPPYHHLSLFLSLFFAFLSFHFSMTVTETLNLLYNGSKDLHLLLTTTFCITNLISVFFFSLFLVYIFFHYYLYSYTMKTGI